MIMDFIKFSLYVAIGLVLFTGLMAILKYVGFYYD